MFGLDIMTDMLVLCFLSHLLFDIHFALTWHGMTWNGPGGTTFLSLLLFRFYTLGWDIGADKVS